MPSSHAGSVPKAAGHAVRKVEYSVTTAKRVILIAPLLALGMLLFADELARTIARTRVPAPIALPGGAEIRESAVLVRLLGVGAFTGRADAVTTGRTILIRPGLSGHISSDWSNLIRHERVHVRQRLRYGRLYLPRYLAAYAWLWLRHGRGAHLYHPFEVEAQRAVIRPAPDQSADVPLAGPPH